MGDVPPKTFLLPTVAVRSTHYGYFWLIIITGTTHNAFRMCNPHGKLFTAAVSIRQGVPLGILVFLPSLPGMVKAELPGTHVGWLVLPIQTLSN